MEKGSAVPYCHTGLQEAQRPQNSKGCFLSSSMQCLILMQAEEETTGSIFDPKRTGGKMYSRQT